MASPLDSLLTDLVVHGICLCYKRLSLVPRRHTRGVQILMQLGKYLVFNHDLHEIGTRIV